MNVLFYDLETAPLLAHAWQARTDYIPHDFFLHDSFLLTWSAKWRGDRQVYSDRLVGEEAQKQDDARIIESLAELVREADYLVAHNIDRFDLPMLNNRLLGLRLEPIGPTQTIDTKTWASRNFRLASNKLDYLADFLGHGKKLKTDFDLWRRSYMGDDKALERMVRYNRRDVRLLEKVFEDLLPYVNRVPRLVAGVKGEMSCVYCGAGRAHLIKRGFRHTAAGSYQLYQCKKCQRYSKAPTAEREMKPGLRPT